MVRGEVLQPLSPLAKRQCRMIDQAPIETVQAAISTSLVMQLIGSVLLLLMLYGVSRIIRQVIERKVEAPDKQAVLQQTTKYAAIAVGVLLLGPIWITQVTAIFAVLSLVAAALTIVNKEFFLNLTAWPVINWRRLFTPGDRVQVGSQVGDVIELGVLYFTLAEIGTGAEAEQLTGRTTKVPNSLVFTQPVTNYSRSLNYVWHQISVVLTPESNWQAAEELVRDVARPLVRTLNPAEKKRIQQTSEAAAYQDESPLVYTQVRDGKRTVVLRYLCRPKRRAALERALWTALLEALEGREDIQLALT